MFALIDGNAFYCSCERAFDPALRQKAVVVLSNNDGCAIARTREAKLLGIKMGEPYHLARDRPGLEQVVWKSSNYALYGDMSRRMYEVLIALAPDVEPYSIDEMFLDFTGIVEPAVLAAEIRVAVLKIAKIPTCVGIGPTKTIAKLANALAKQDPNGAGVFDLTRRRTRAAIYATVDVDEVWGIGAATAEKLHRLGCRTIADFVQLPDDTLRSALTVVGLRTAWELRGISCMAMSMAPSTKKSLAVTRSFGRAVTAWPEMESALATYAARAAEKLRRHQLIACAMQVFMLTSPFAKSAPSYSNQITIALEPSADSFALIATAVRAGRSLWRDGFRYAKAGVVLMDLSPAAAVPQDFFPSRDPARSKAMMQAMDALNTRYGRQTVRPGLVTSGPRWAMRRANLSPRYTTCIGELFKAKA